MPSKKELGARVFTVGGVKLGGSTRAKLRETRAMMIQARYLGLDLGVVHTGGSGFHVVFSHGLYASAGVFRPLRADLTTRFDPCFHSFSYLPGPGIEELSHRLQNLISAIPGDRPIHLIGHSLGALAQRYYLASSSCDSRIVQSVSLAAPFRGSRRNWLVPGQAGSDLAPSSTILALLRAPTPENCRIPHLTLVAEEDEMIESDAFPRYGEHAIIPEVGHNGILFHEKTKIKVSARLRPSDLLHGPLSTVVREERAAL